MLHSMRTAVFNFPEAHIAPNSVAHIKVDVDKPFRAERLIMSATMAEIRGHFKIRHTRLPLLNRENVIAYSNVTRVKSKRRTTVEYREHATGNFVRSYLPENVVYVPTDPLSYIYVEQVHCGHVPVMPSVGGGVTAQFFGAGVLGNGFRLPVTDMTIRVVLRNESDILVHVWSSIAGTLLA